jgi:hypothetical protein
MNFFYDKIFNQSQTYFYSFKLNIKKYFYTNIKLMEKTNTKVSEETVQNLSDMAHKLRIHAIEMTDITGSG